MAETAKLMRERIIENVKLTFQTVTNFIDYCIYIRYIISYKVPNLRGYFIYLHKFHGVFRYVLTTILSLELFNPTY